jgi:hypothetical protein
VLYLPAVLLCCCSTVKQWEERQVWEAGLQEPWEDTACSGKCTVCTQELCSAVHLLPTSYLAVYHFTVFCGSFCSALCLETVYDTHAAPAVKAANIRTGTDVLETL